MRDADGRSGFTPYGLRPLHTHQDAEKVTLCHSDPAVRERNLLVILRRSKKSIRRGGLGSAQTADPRNDNRRRFAASCYGASAGTKYTSVGLN